MLGTETELEQVPGLAAPESDSESPSQQSAPARKRNILKISGLVVLVILSLIDAGLLVMWGSRAYAPTRPGWTCLPVSRGGLICQNIRSWYRGRSYARRECVDALVEAAQHLRDRMPHVKVAYMDASDANGGRFMKHRSHREGVDVDVMFIGRTWYGAPCPAGPSIFTTGYGVKYDRSRRHGSTTFDAGANWLFLEGLYLQQSARVEAIFVESYIREWLLQAGREMNAPEEIRKWASSVLANAGKGAGDHKDHFHVRFARRDRIASAL
ncbi:penicillin-insensitive murein endopeptidase [bacterium]|nr:penicillin-insensitive murein endopeptidase [bacterium]